MTGGGEEGNKYRVNERQAALGVGDKEARAVTRVSRSRQWWWKLHSIQRERANLRSEDVHCQKPEDSQYKSRYVGSRYKEENSWRGREQERRPCGDSQVLVLWSKWDTERVMGDCGQWDKMLLSTR